jgi:hypothetical protein
LFRFLSSQEWSEKMKRKMVAAFVAMILVSISGIFAIRNFDTIVSGQTPSVPEVKTGAAGPKASSLSQERLLDQVFFDMLFNTILSMEKAAENLRSEGKSGDIWKGYFERRASLTRSQARELRRITAEFERKIAPIQIRAFQVISERRAARARGETTSKRSDELLSLQSQRDAIAIRYGTELLRSLGLPIVDKLREVMNQNNGNSPGISDVDRHDLMERFRNERVLTKRGAQGGQQQ